jgi:hypothetical protein
MRRQLEDLATTVLQGDCVAQISKVTMKTTLLEYVEKLVVEK